MARAVSLLTLIVAFTIPIWIRRGSHHIEYLSPLSLFAYGGLENDWTLAHLTPLLLLLLACVLPYPRLRGALQAAGSLWILFLLAWVISAHRDMWIATAYLIPSCGWAATCLLESGFLPLRSPADVWRRPSAALWLALAAQQIYVACHWNDIWLRGNPWVFLLRGSGLACACLLLAWGRWNSVRWTLWTGALLAGGLAAELVWTHRASFLGRSMFFAHRELPRMLIHLSLLFLSLRRALRPNHEATEKS